MVKCGDLRRLPYGIVCKLLADGALLESCQGWVPLGSVLGGVKIAVKLCQGIKKLQDLKLKSLRLLDRLHEKRTLIEARVNGDYFSAVGPASTCKHCDRPDSVSSCIFFNRKDDAERK